MCNQAHILLMLGIDKGISTLLESPVFTVCSEYQW